MASPRPRQTRKDEIDGFCAVGQPGIDPRRGRKNLFAFRRCLLAEEGQGGRLPRRFPPRAGGRRLARHLYPRGIWRVGARHHRRRDHDADDFGIGRRHVRRIGRAYERVRAQSRRRVRHQGAVHAHAAADHRRPGQVLLRGDRTQYRAQYHAVENPRGAPGRQVHRQRPEGLDFHGTGRQQDLAAGAHHAAGGGEDADAGLEPVLHGFRQAARHRARDRKDGPQARRFQRIVLREFRDPGRGSPRRGRPRLRIYPARHESRAHPDRGGSGGARPDRAVARRGLCQEPHRVQSPDRHESRHPASAGEELDGAGSRVADGALGRLAIRPGHAMRPGRQCREISRCRSRLPRLRAGGHDAWRLRLRQGISRRALFAGIPDPAHRADQPAAHSQLYRREGARSCRSRIEKQRRS